MTHDVRMRGFKQRADVEEVVRWLDGLALAERTQRVAVAEAAGRVLAEDLVSRVDVPAFRRAAMDGWAVRGEDTFGAAETEPIALDVIGLALPGAAHGGRVGPHEAVRIMTGAPVPDGADAVLPAEEGSESDGRLSARGAVAPGKHVGDVGEDIRADTRLLARGRRLRPQDVGVAASVGCGDLEVRARPRVAILPTGDELLPPGRQPAGARIVDSNTPMLSALVERDGGIPRAQPILADRPEVVREALAASDADILLVSGGSSVGQEDHAPRMVAELGELRYHGVALRPAAPTGIGRIGDTLVFLLPGNPVSCLCAYDLFAGRVVRRMGGRAPEWPYPREHGTLARKVASALGRMDYVRVRRDGDAIVPLMTRGASILSSTTEADGFLIVPRDSEGYDAGERVAVWSYDLA